MPINQISTSNTFAQWVVATQALIEKQNFVEDSANLITDTANSIVIFVDDSTNTINLIISDTENVYSNTVNVYSNTVNVYNSIQEYVESAYDTANTVLLISNNSYDTSNLALFNANLALQTSNTFFEYIFNIEDTSSNANTFYLTFVDNTAGVPADVFISSSKLFYVPLTGTLSATDFNSTSDITLKENIIEIEKSLNILEKLKGIKFNWKDTKEISYGLSAQDVEKVLPEIVKTRENGLKGVNYLNLIAILIESVKELKKEIEELKNHK
jgi:hypothetical protein